MFFGEFLVEKKILSERQLVEAVNRQICELPPLCDLAHKNDLLNESQLFKVLSRQQTDGTDFKTACEAVDVWSDELNEKLCELVAKVRRPLVEILLEDKQVDFNALVGALDDYLHLSGEESPAEHKPGEGQEPTQKTGAENAMSADMLDEFAQQVSESKKKALLELISKLSPDAVFGEASLHLTNIFDIFHQMRGTCRFVGAVKCELVIEKGEELVDQLRAGYIGQNSDAISADIKKITSLTEILFGFADHIKQSGTEDNYSLNLDEELKLAA